MDFNLQDAVCFYQLPPGVLTVCSLQYCFQK